MQTIITTLAAVALLSWVGTAQAGHHEGSAGHGSHGDHDTPCEHAPNAPCPHAAKGEVCPHHNGNQCSHTADEPCTAEDTDSEADA